jgi:UDP-N-acetylglucosamine:LPS N-acetylglucosamine transferase
LPSGGAPVTEATVIRYGPAVVVTNNHFRGQSAANAKMLESMVEGRAVEAPPELVSTYAEALRPFAVPSPSDEQPRLL